MKKVWKKLIGIPVVFFSGSALVFAQAGDPPQIGELSGLLDNVFQWIMPIGGLVVLIMLVYGGYMYMISQGDPANIKKAQGTITWAILGLFFLAVFWIILQIVFDWIGGA